MSDDASMSRDVAQRLWRRVAGGDPTLDVERALDISDRVLTALDADLRRWVGAEGYAALLKRATVMAEAQHPALRHVPDLELESAPGRHEHLPQVAEIVEGMIALTATMMELLGRIIGIGMAARLMERVGVPSPRGVVSTSLRNHTDD